METNEAFNQECQKKIDETTSKLSRWKELNEEMFNFMYSKIENQNDRIYIDKLKDEQKSMLN